VAIAFLQCESHPGRLLTDHLLDVGSRLSAELRVVGLSHDLGKATEYFQHYLAGDKGIDPKLRRHALLGAELVLEILARKLDESAVSPEQALLAYSYVKRHHGALDNLLDFCEPDAMEACRLACQRGGLDQEGLLGWLREQGCAGRPLAPTERTGMRFRTRQILRAASEAEGMARFQRALCGFGEVIEADRDAAAGYPLAYFVRDPRFKLEKIDRFRASLPNHGSSTISELRNAIFESALEGARRGGASSGHLWTLTAPTGSGKTLAALAWALERRAQRLSIGCPNCSIVYSLPFTSIIDQNAAVFSGVYGETDLDESILSVHHHTASPGPLATTGEESLARIWTEGWRADVVCTTFVQVVNALFHATGQDSRRMQRLAGGILILDEVQAIPAELWRPVRIALESLAMTFGTDVLLMSATQPGLLPSDATELVAQPLAERFAEIFDRYDVSFELGAALTIDNLADDLRRIISDPDAPNCLVILNTINEALDLFRLVDQSDWHREIGVVHLSTNLRPKDRRSILTEIGGRRPARHILISTQVVEAGLDLSYGLVIRALAPIDSIVQAAGRANRHGGERRALVRVIELSGDSASRVYGSMHINTARSVLRGRRRLREGEMAEVVRDYFRELGSRKSESRAREILDAVRMMEFAFLRGEANDSRNKLKHVYLIEELPGRVPHYIAMDAEDVRVWSDFLSALESGNFGQLRRLRALIGDRIVEVPSHSRAGDPDARTGLVYVDPATAQTLYDSRTGFRRE
jgi:CRISPR-associated endonuclease/helicase Cas3